MVRIIRCADIKGFQTIANELDCSDGIPYDGCEELLAEQYYLEDQYQSRYIPLAQQVKPERLYPQPAFVRMPKSTKELKL